MYQAWCKLYIPMAERNRRDLRGTFSIFSCFYLLEQCDGLFVRDFKVLYEFSTVVLLYSYYTPEGSSLINAIWIEPMQ